MDTAVPQLVAGIFPSDAQADTAVQDLHRIGITDQHVTVGVPAPGRYRIEYHESEELGRGVVNGIAIGVPLGSIVAIGMLLLAVPDLALASAYGLGILVGGFWGIFFGGLGGMVKTALAHAEEEPRYAVATSGTEVLVIADAGELSGAAHKVMRKDGARCFLEDIPSVQPSGVALGATG